MGTLLFLIVGGLLTLGIFCFLCSNTRMVSFDGVNGFARGYLDLFIWSVLIAAGIMAGVWYIFGGIFSFLYDMIFSENTLALILFGSIILFCKGRGRNMKKRKRELDNSDCFLKNVITYAAGEDGKKAQDIWYVDKNRIFNTKEGLLVNAIKIRKNDSNSTDLEQFSYRTMIFSKKEDGGPNDYEVGMMGPEDDNNISMSGTTIKDFEDKEEKLDNISLLEKLCKGEDKVVQREIYDFSIGDNSGIEDLYQFITKDNKKYIQTM